LKYQLIYDMINARIAGTAVHLGISDNNEMGQISYKKYKIWGFKTLLAYLFKDIYDIFYNYLPKNENLLDPEKHLIKPLEFLCERYLVPFSLVINYINKRKAIKQIWETLDSDQQAMFIINAFFEAFEENLINSYYLAISFSKLITLNPKINATLKHLDFGLGDFGFVYRARGYAYIFSKKVCNNGFGNTVKRLNRLLLKEYKNTFTEKIKNPLNTIEQKNSDVISELSEEKRYVIEMLKQGNVKEKLEAINLIVQNQIYEALDELEYHLNDKNDRIINAAYEAVIILKDLK